MHSRVLKSRQKIIQMFIFARKNKQKCILGRSKRLKIFRIALWAGSRYSFVDTFYVFQCDEPNFEAFREVMVGVVTRSSKKKRALNLAASDSDVEVENNLFTVIPEVAYIKIMEFLHPTDVGNIDATCRDFWQLSRENSSAVSPWCAIGRRLFSGLEIKCKLYEEFLNVNFITKLCCFEQFCNCFVAFL